jgi:hypothetical protein
MSAGVNAVISKYLISRIEENMVIFGSKYIDLG